MLSVRIEFLRGVSVTTAFNDRDATEWPPHPARLFSALVDVWGDDEDSDEAAALRWLEGQEPPALTASDAHRRTVAPVFVPVNDATTLPSAIDNQIRKLDAAEEVLRGAVGPKALAKAEKAVEKARQALLAFAAEKARPDPGASDQVARDANRVLPAFRVRQPRTFPVAIPHDPVVWMTWPHPPPEEHRAALARLAARVHRLGHSSSLVGVSLEAAPPDPTHVPDRESAEHTLRWVEAGQLDRLVEGHALHQRTEPRVLPSRFVGYRRAASSSPVPRGTLGERWMVLERVDGPRLPIVQAAAVARALRGAVLRGASEPIRPIVSGHEADGTPLERPHVAYVALPFVGRRHADGRILGVAVLLPRDATGDDERYVADALANSCDRQGHLRLTLGRAGVLTVMPVEGIPASRTLQPGPWVRPSAYWVSVTPIALDRNPGDLRDPDPARRARARAEAEALVARSCTHIGLPEPVHVAIDVRPPIVGASHVRHHPPFPLQPGKLRRVQVHARITFPVPVKGPLLVGAGRYAGLGLLRPVREEAE